MPAQKSRVNLLPLSEFEVSFWGRFLKWAVTTGRYIIILTELVVIIAFLSRFKLDEDLRNLNEQINGQISYLQSQEPLEKEFRNVQKRTNMVDKILATRLKAVEGLDYLENRVPVEIAVNYRSITKDQIKIVAVTLSEQAMGNLLSTMSADGVWRSIDMTELLGDKKVGIKFSLSAKK